MINYELLNNNILKISDENNNLFFKFFSDESFRIYSSEHKSYTVLKNKKAYKNYEFELKNDIFSIKTTKLNIEIGENFTLKIYFENKLMYDGHIQYDYKFKQENLELKEKEGHKVSNNSDYKFLFKAALFNEDNFFGLGDKTGYLNKKYYQFVNYNTDDPSIQLENMPSLYKSINLSYNVRKDAAFAIYLDNTYKSIFDFGTDLKEYYFGSLDGEIDVYFYFNKDINKLISNVTKDLGRNDIPPLKALGNNQSRWSYFNKEEVENVIEGYKKYDIPLDVVHLDIDYMEKYKDFTINENSFPNFHNWLHELKNKYGVSIVTIIDAGVKKEEGYHIYDEGIANNYFATLNGKLYVNEVWPGESVFPNFNSQKVRNWWSDHCKTLKETGILGIWNDMNEPASFKGPLPDDVEFKDDKKINHYHKEIHNVYGHLMTEATYKGIEKTGLRPFVITRAAFMGSNRYSCVWTGDNHSIYAHLQLSIPQLINLNLCGFAFSGTDVGGFSANCTKELLIRWIESAFLSPFLRNHSALGTKNQEPYNFDSETALIYKKFVDLRYELLPYLYDTFYKHYLTGAPIMRPLFLYDQKDENTYNINDQFMVGENLMLCPIVEQGKTSRIVYLPIGRWVDYFTNKIYVGGKKYMFEVPLNETLMFVKYNSIIPTFDRFNRIQDDYNHIIFKGYGKKCKYFHYKDDYNTLNYKNGNYAEIVMKMINKSVHFSVKNNGINMYENIDFIDILNDEKLL